MCAFFVFPRFRQWAKARLWEMPNFDYEQLADSIREAEVLPTGKPVNALKPAVERES